MEGGVGDGVGVGVDGWTEGWEWERCCVYGQNDWIE